MQITNTQARIIELPDAKYKLVPGLNFVSDDAWNRMTAMKGFKQVRRYIEKGYLRVGAEKLPEEDLPSGGVDRPAPGLDGVPAGSDAPPENLKGLERRAWSTLINAQSDRAVLTAWGEADNRSAVHNAIEKRLAEINGDV